MFLDFISYSSGPLPEEQLQVRWGAVRCMGGWACFAWGLVAGVGVGGMQVCVAEMQQAALGPRTCRCWDPHELVWGWPTRASGAAGAAPACRLPPSAWAAHAGGGGASEHRVGRGGPLGEGAVGPPAGQAPMRPGVSQRAGRGGAGRGGGLAWGWAERAPRGRWAGGAPHARAAAWPRRTLPGGAWATQSTQMLPPGAANPPAAGVCPAAGRGPLPPGGWHGMAFACSHRMHACPALGSGGTHAALQPAAAASPLCHARRARCAALQDEAPHLVNPLILGFVERCTSSSATA